ELDQVSPRLDTLIDLCRSLGITLGDFFQPLHATPRETNRIEIPPEHAGFQKGVSSWLEHAEALIRYSADSLCVLDSDGFAIYESDCALQFHGGSFEERRSRPWWTCAHPDEQAEVRSSFEAFVEKGEPNALIQFRALHRDGTWRWVRTTLSRQLDHPLIQGVIASTQDVTLLRRMEEDAARSQKSDSLAIALGGITHSFSNLLMVIQAQLELVQVKQGQDSTINPNLACMEEALQCAKPLLERMRDYAGNPILATEPLDLNALILDSAMTLRTLSRQGDSLRYELEERTLPINADRRLLKRLLLDLVANAFDAIADMTEGGGTVTLRTAYVLLTADEIQSEGWVERDLLKPGDCVILEIKDTGCGIAPELLSRLFDPFFTTKFMGRGMSLSAVQGTVRAHGGGIRMTSQLGHGSCFQILLPLATPRQTAVLEHVARTPNPVFPGTVLIAEDDVVLRECIRGMLELLGHREVLEAENGEQALCLYLTHAERVGLVILDLDMPVMGGIEAFTKLRGLNPSLKILFSTGAWQRDPRLAVKLSEGVTALLHKPYHMEELRNALTSLA
ncbi:MAG: response regulator, partial [Holophaga sp.]|nr:response regulator [Holophaga sp.]